MASIEIKGLSEIRARMLALPKKLDRKLLNKALLVGAVSIRDEARLRAPLLVRADPRRRRGTVQKAIRAQAGKPYPGMTATVIVRVKRLTKAQIRRFKVKHGKSGAENPSDPFYWWHQEFGTSKQPAKKFMRNAFESKKGDAARNSKDALAFIVLDEANKLGRGGV